MKDWKDILWENIKDLPIPDFDKKEIETPKDEEENKADD